jgi:hypothetical protein
MNPPHATGARPKAFTAWTPLGEPTRSTPAIAGNRLYFRTLSHLSSVGGE